MNQLAFIGLGNMGGGMAHRLLDQGHRLTVFNRTSAKAKPLVEAGAVLADSPEGAAEGQHVVLLSLSDERAVEEVLFGRVVPVLAPGALVVDTSTVSPGYARDAAGRLSAQGLRRVEACVVGNPFQAREGALRVYVSGDEDDFAEVRPVLDALGTQVLHLGPPGTATSMKLVLNLLLGAQVAALSEAIAYGVASGLDRTQLITSISDSGFSSVVMKFRAALMKENRYEPAFFRADLMEKDIDIATTAAHTAGLTLPVLDTVLARFHAVVAAGDGAKDAAVIAEHQA
ncbi:NAD(P)-dependent oxidoreductase [Streptomyces roseirectus]|uniref:NAD(P)-dependent oxidoreductase n=1 Tax=Streptomyces roseirectus TaxID=2768066 RepID=A0A7H0IA51_9ACTN|nr:NAD(P)-dependent oxidoreductase [Streptomyces roseirectus]QNP69667.1 NAD(P)-dependent oxidoreductase [Streptomyces roseirectus]